MNTHPTLLWFRQDLRTSDNPALIAAIKSGDVIPVYIYDEKNAGDHAYGEAAKVWLHHALSSLNDSLDKKLVILSGNAEEIIPALAQTTNAQNIYWNRCYEPWRIKRDKTIKTTLKNSDINVETFNASLLWEPWDITKADGTPYKVFTPFYRKGCLNASPPREPLRKPGQIKFAEHNVESLNIDGLKLLPQKPDPRWDIPMTQHWDISEEGAHTRFQKFLENGIQDYKEGRNMPAQDNVSRMSPYLRWGMISPNQMWYGALQNNDPHDKNIDHFLSELGWREFSYALLYYFPDITWKNLQSKFDDFPWNNEQSDALTAWQNGQTGYPIVDAGMRELYTTGYMHNRVRMIVGSFLVKHLLIHWHQGEKWFWDCLVDADLASNSASWQWIAGCGADAAPYFRIFNPITQGEKFDKDGEYIRKWVPELYDLPNKYLNRPWEAPQNVLEYAKVKLGKTYPKPIVDHFEARDKALTAFQTAKAN